MVGGGLLFIMTDVIQNNNVKNIGKHLTACTSMPCNMILTLLLKGRGGSGRPSWGHKES